MSKIISKKKLSFIIFFFIVVVLLSAGYKILLDGFSIQNLKIGKISIEQLYLKLDNKLVLDIRKLNISEFFADSSKKSSSSEDFDIESMTDKVKYAVWAISYFQKFSIKEIDLGNNHKAMVVYDGKQYSLQFPNIEARFAIEENNADINLKILSLIFKEIKIQADGNIIYSTQSRKLGFKLIVSPSQSDVKNNAKLFLQGITDLKTLDLRAKSSEIKDISFLKQYFEKVSDLGIRSWLFEKIKFSNLQINHAQFQANLSKKRFLTSIAKTANMSMSFKSPQIYLESHLEPITAKIATLKFGGERVKIHLEAPMYDGINLEGSSLEFSDLSSAPKLDIVIVSQDFRYTKALEDLLKIYDIKLPLDSIEAPIQADVKLFIQFFEESKVSASGLFKLEQGKVSLYSIPLYAQSATISLDITPDYGHVYIDAIHARYQNIADVDLHILLDTQKKHLQARADIYKLQINTNNDINTAPYHDVFMNTTSEQNTQKSQDFFSQNSAVLVPEDTNIFSPKNDRQITPNLSIKNSPEQLSRRKIIETIKAQAQEKFTQEIFNANPLKTLLPISLDQTNATKSLDEEKIDKVNEKDEAKKLSSLEFEVDFSDAKVTVLSIPDFAFKMIFQDELYTIEAQDFSKFIPYSPLINYLGITAGSLRISTPDFKAFGFTIHLSDLSLPLYQKNAQKLSEISISGKIDSSGLNASSPNQEVSFSTKKNQNNINFKNIDFNLDEFLQSEIPAIKEIFINKNHTKLTLAQIEEETQFIKEKQRYERAHNIDPHITVVDCDNLVLTYQEYKIPSDTINLRLRDGRLSADATYKNGVVNLDVVHDNIFIKASNFSGDFVDQVIKKNIVNGGLYTLTGIYRDEVFNGELKIQNTLIKDFAILQNIVGFIDSVPSLIVFKNPGLGAKGFEIQQGHVVFAVNSKYIGLERINFIGSSMDIDGNGIVEKKSEEINMNLSISTVKNLSNIINKIPIVGYLILGKEGKISTNLIINGTLQNPKVQVTLAQDTITAPFNILKRIFTPIDIIVDEIIKETR